jgi:hypothetical protein
MEKHIYLLLHAVKKNSDIKMLIREGLTYVDIAQLTKNTIEEGLIIYKGEDILLSESGEEFYERIKDNYKRTDKAEWIEKEFQYQVPKLNKNLIFVPSQYELTFKVNSRRPVETQSPPES